MKRIIILLIYFVLFYSCVPKSQYDSVILENEKLKAENEELLNGEVRTIAIVESAYKSADYETAKIAIERLKHYHPQSKKNIDFENMLKKINEKEAEIAREKEKEEKEIIRKENYNNTGNWYVLPGYYIEYKLPIFGTFSNSATENSKLKVEIRINKAKNVEIKLFEYAGSNPLKATSISPDEYYVTVWYQKDKNSSERDLKLFHAINKSDYLVVDGVGSKFINQVLLSEKPIEIWISGTGHDENSKYKFTINNLEWFENALRKIDEK